MKCPFCGFLDSQVKDSRLTEDGACIRRRRECPECGSRFTTFERVQLRELVVVKKNGDKERFDREKLELSLQLAVPPSGWKKSLPPFSAGWKVREKRKFPRA